MFNSDRAGTPQLYVMNADGSGVQRISFGAGRYGSPAWSPRGDLIAFTKIQGGLFHIGVMRPDGSDERLLTRSTLDEGPTWSPNGRVILFTPRGLRDRPHPLVQHRRHRLQRARGADAARRFGSRTGRTWCRDRGMLD